NRVLALAAAGGRLYAAAGDAGLLTYDISGFTSPFAVRSVAASASTSIVSTGDHVYIAPATGGLVEYTQGLAGQLTLARSWNASTVSSVRDGGSGLLLTTSGATATMWALT